MRVTVRRPQQDATVTLLALLQHTMQLGMSRALKYARHWSGGEPDPEGCLGQVATLASPTGTLPRSQVGGVEGSPINVQGVATVDVTFAGKTVQGEFIISDSLRASAILGLDYLEKNHCIIDTTRRTLILQELVVPLQSSLQDPNITQSEVAVRDTLKIPAFCERETMACAIQPLMGGTWLLASAKRDDVPALVAGGLVTPW